MSRGVNKVILVGNLGNDPDVRFTPNGSAVANLSVATSESWVDKNTQQRQDRTEWHRVAIFGKLAEICQQYLRKGSKVYIEGKLQTRKWQDQQGQDRYTTEIIVDGFNGQMQMLDGRQEGGMGAAPSEFQPRSAPPASQATTQVSQQHYGGAQQQTSTYTPPQQQQAPRPASAPQQQQQQQQQQQPQTTPATAGGGFDDFDDDIPF